MSRVKKVIDEIKRFTPAEKIEFARSLIKTDILQSDNFNEEEIREIEVALQEVAEGKWVDFDEFRKRQNL